MPGIPTSDRERRCDRAKGDRVRGGAGGSGERDKVIMTSSFLVRSGATPVGPVPSSGVEGGECMVSGCDSSMAERRKGGREAEEVDGMKRRNHAGRIMQRENRGPARIRVKRGFVKGESERSQRLMRRKRESPDRPAHPFRDATSRRSFAFHHLFLFSPSDRRMMQPWLTTDMVPARQ